MAICFVNGRPNNVAVKEIRIDHGIVQTFQGKVRKNKTRFIHCREA